MGYDSTTPTLDHHRIIDLAHFLKDSRIVDLVVHYLDSTFNSANCSRDINRRSLHGTSGIAMSRGHIV
jgi:hypothetical protein